VSCRTSVGAALPGRSIAGQQRASHRPTYTSINNLNKKNPEERARRAASRRWGNRAGAANQPLSTDFRSWWAHHSAEFYLPAAILRLPLKPALETRSRGRLPQG